MNELIMRIFVGFTVDGTPVPVKFMYYEGHGEPYVFFMKQDADNSLTGDDQLIAHVEYYDFDVYAKGNYNTIVERVKEELTANGFVWQVSRSSGDMFETDTGYYHTTLNFAIYRED